MRESFMYGVVGLLAGILISGFLPWGSKTETVEHSHGHEMSMADMTEALRGKSGEEFDKAFLEMMIPHHEGAVDMAELARAYAGHEEIKALADSISVSQKKEIADMKAWQSAWGY